MINQKIAQAAKEYSEQFTELQIPQAKADFLAGAAKLIELLSEKYKKELGIDDLEYHLDKYYPKESVPFALYFHLLASQLEVEKMREAIEKFITKSNGLSFFAREMSERCKLRLGHNEILEKLDNLYEYQCEVEELIRKKTK